MAMNTFTKKSPSTPIGFFHTEKDPMTETDALYTELREQRHLRERYESYSSFTNLDYFEVMPKQKFDRLERARQRARARGWEPLTPKEHKEMMEAVADCTNL